MIFVPSIWAEAVSVSSKRRVHGIAVVGDARGPESVRAPRAWTAAGPHSGA